MIRRARSLALLADELWYVILPLYASLLFVSREVRFSFYICTDERAMYHEARKDGYRPLN